MGLTHLLAPAWFSWFMLLDTTSRGTKADLASSCEGLLIHELTVAACIFIPDKCFPFHVILLGSWASHSLWPWIIGFFVFKKNPHHIIDFCHALLKLCNALLLFC